MNPREVVVEAVDEHERADDLSGANQEALGDRGRTTGRSRWGGAGRGASERGPEPRSSARDEPPRGGAAPPGFCHRGTTTELYLSTRPAPRHRPAPDSCRAFLAHSFWVRCVSATAPRFLSAERWATGGERTLGMRNASAGAASAACLGGISMPFAARASASTISSRACSAYETSGRTSCARGGEARVRWESETTTARVDVRRTERAASHVSRSSLSTVRRRSAVHQSPIHPHP